MHYAYGDSYIRSCMVVRTMHNRFRRLDYVRSDKSIIIDYGYKIKLNIFSFNS